MDFVKYSKFELHKYFIYKQLYIYPVECVQRIWHRSCHMIGTSNRCEEMRGRHVRRCVGFGMKMICA